MNRRPTGATGLGGEAARRDPGADPAAAVETTLRSRVAVSTGGPGVGKTTLVNAGPCRWRAFGRVSSGSVKGVRKAGLEVP